MMKNIVLITLLVGMVLPVSAKPPTQLILELNKLEQQEAACRLHILFKNGTHLRYEQFEIDLVFFDKNNIILKQLSIDAAPLRNNKQILKPFDIPGMSCNEIGHLLLNDVFSCKVSGEQVQDCLTNVHTYSTSKIPFRM